MLKDYDDLTKEVLPYVPGCPDAAIGNAIRNAAIELCNRSMVWQILGEEETLAAGEDEYEVDTPEQGELVMLMEVWVAGSRVGPVPPDLMHQIQTEAWPIATGTPRSYIEEEGRIRFVPVPDVNVTVVTRAAFRPTLDSTGLEESLYHDYWQAIRAGALSRLQEIPGQTWTDMKQSQVNLARFAAGLGNARIAANRGRSRSILRIELPRRL